MIDLRSSVRMRIRTSSILGSSPSAIALAFLIGSAPAVAQDAGTKVADPAGSSSTAANPNEGPAGAAQKDAVAAVTGDATAAQTSATAQAATAPAPDDTPAIVVTGFRRSLETAVAEKKKLDLIVESVSAEDIGKLPDASIAESIARLPGLTAQRSAGRDTTIAIRGFSPDFSTTLLNGREQTSTGDNRAVEYDQYPAEVINQVVVYKSGQANVIGQGLSGTVDLRTIRPLEFGHRVISIGARGSYDDKGKLNPDSNKFGYRANGVFIDQFADGRIGVALSGSYSDEEYQIQEFNAWGYYNPDSSGNAAISGSKSFDTSNSLKRYGVTGTLEAKVTDTLTETFDGFYSNFKDDQLHRGIELPFSYYGPSTNGNQTIFTGTSAANGLYTSGSFGGVQGVVRNNAFQRHAKLYAFGSNTTYKGDDGWGAFLDVSYSKTDRSENDIESYSGTGYGYNDTDATDTIGFMSGDHGTSFTHKLNYSDPNLIKLTDPLGWGGSVDQAGYNNDRLIKDRIWQFRDEVSKQLDSSFLSGVRIGMNYTNHDKSLDPVENFLELASGALQETIPSQYIEKSTVLTYLGLGPILTYNPFDLLKGGIYTLVPNAVPDVFIKGYAVHEDLITFYGQADIKAQLGNSTLTGNFGLQAVHTDQKSNGQSIANINGVVTLKPLQGGASYWDLMPSANLSLRMPSDIIIRAALSREVMRPRMVDMNAAFTYGTSNAIPGVITPSGSKGNPELRPYRANAADLTLEKYFGLKGYLALQGFYKNFTSYVITGQQTAYDFTGLPFTGNQPTTYQGFVDQPINLKGIKLYGAELAGTLPFGVIVPALSGFGFTGSGAYTKAKSKQLIDGSTTPPGYSKWVANGTLYFEKAGFSLRGSARYRSKFRGEVTGLGDQRTLREAKPEMIADAQIGYDFAKGTFLQGLSLYLQGQNLTDRPFVTYDPSSTEKIIDYQEFGRRFLAGFTYKF